MPRTPRIITLYAPSLSLTIDSFCLRPDASLASILASMRAALGDVAQAYPYDLKRQPISRFTDWEAGKTVLVGTDYFEEPLAEKRGNVQSVLGGAAAKAWMALTPLQRRAHILSHLSSTSNSDTGLIYLTLTLPLIQSRLSAISHTPPTSAASLAVIAENWTLPLDAVLGFQGMMAPNGMQEDWDVKLLAALAVLSECLVAQEGVAGRLVLERVKTRKGRDGGGLVVGWGDVVEVGRGLVERSG